MKNIKKEVWVIIAFLALCITWGTTYLVIRISVQEFPPECFSGIRFTLSGVIILIAAMIFKQELPNKIEDILKISVSGLLMLLGGHGLVVYAEQWVHSGVTALVLSMGPIFIAILELLILKTRTLNIYGWIGLFSGFGGVALLVLTGKSSGSIDMVGGLMLLGACVMFSLGTIFSKKYKASGSIVGQLAVQMIAGGLGLFLTGVLLGETSRFTINYTIVWTMAYLTIFGSIIGYGCYIFVLKNWPASKAGTYSYVNTVIAVILGSLILKEPMNINVIISVIIILGAVFMVQASKPKNSEILKIENEDK